MQELEFGSRIAGVCPMRQAVKHKALGVRTNHRLYSSHMKHLEEEIEENGSVFEGESC